MFKPLTIIYAVPYYVKRISKIYSLVFFNFVKEKNLETCSYLFETLDVMSAMCQWTAMRLL